MLFVQKLRSETERQLDLLTEHFKLIDVNKEEARKEEAIIDSIIGERLRIRTEVCAALGLLWARRHCCCGGLCHGVCVRACLCRQRENAAKIIILRNYRKFKEGKARKEAESKKAKGGKKKK